MRETISDFMAREYTGRGLAQTRRDMSTARIETRTHETTVYACDWCGLTWDAEGYAEECERGHAVVDGLQVAGPVAWYSEASCGEGVVVRIDQSRWRGGVLAEVTTGDRAGERHWINGWAVRAAQR